MIHSQKKYSGLGASHRLIAEVLALLYIAVIAIIAHDSGAYYILFPELGTLAYDVLVRPQGRWCNSPVHIIITPVLTAAAGILITRCLPYGFPSVLLCVAVSIAIVLMLRSPIVPAVSAGLLPLVLDVKSAWYPPGVLLGTLVLAALCLPWRRLHLPEDYRRAAVNDKRHYTAEVISRSGLYRMLWVFAFVAIAMGLVWLTGERFVLFPPLAVIAYEMIVHPDTCPWASRTMRLPLVCLLAAVGGLLCYHFLGVGPWAAVSSMALGIIILRAGRLHLPPALAIALLPQVMHSPAITYPLAVLLGTLVLSLWSLLYGFLQRAEKH